MKDHVVVSGLSGEWITAEGLSLHVEAPRPLGDSLLFLVCDVPSFAGYSADSLSPRLLLQRSDGPPVELTVQARPAGSAVELQAKFPPAFSSVSADLALTFRPHFVPKLLGMNHDERKLCARFFDIGIRHNRNATVTASDVAAVPEGRHRPMP